MRLFAPLAVLLTVLACATSASAAVRATELATFDQPVYATSPPDDPRRIFVVEKQGTIRVLRDGAKVDTPFLDISGNVTGGGEQGLLSLAFAPDYAASGRFYVYYTDNPTDAGGNDNNIVVEEYTRSPDPDRANPTRTRRLLEIPHPDNQNHNGGQLMFGRDGFLWVTTGDGGGQGDPDNSAQDPRSELGKVLRVDIGSGAVTTWASGLRNPYRASVDRGTGDVIVGDVGGGIAEEINLIRAGTGPGLNFGWNCHEGSSLTGEGCTVPNRTDPVIEKRHDATRFRSIIGGPVVRDPALRELNGRYLYGDFFETQLRSAVLSGGPLDDRAAGLSISQLSGLGEDSCGHIYATSLSGPVYRLDGDVPPSPCTGAAPPTGTAGPAPDTAAPALGLSRRRTQRVLRQKGVVAAVTCNEACGFTASARMRIGRVKKRYSLKKVSRLAQPAQRRKIKLRLWPKGVRALRRAQARKRRAAVTVTIVARDGAGNQTTRKLGIRAKR